MSRIATTILGALILASLAVAPALAEQYPPGPGGLCPDSVSIYRVQNPAAACHPVLGDTVRGMGGVVTGVDPKPTGFAYYLQTAGGPAWTGIDLFIGSSPIVYAQGDSLVVTLGQVGDYGGETEVFAANGAFGNNLGLRYVSSGNPLPPFHIGTAAELQELPSNPNAEQWECMLVRIENPLRVVRNSLTGGMGTNNSFLVVDTTACPPGSIGPCDSVFVDGNTLTTYAPPAVGVKIMSVQGIYNQRSRGYRIQLRDGNDLEVATPPNLVDGYPVADDTLRVTFDRTVTQASAENTANYTLASFGTVLSATLESNGMAVNLGISNGLVDGDNEAVTVSGIVSLASGLPMTGPQTRSFINGVLPITMIQAPNPDSLVGACIDRSKFAGAGGGTGTRLTFRGICAGALSGNLYYLEEAAATPRSGLTSYAPMAPLSVGRQYLWVGRVQEYYGETEASDNVYIRDEGPATVPDPVVQTVAVLEDSTCDATQTLSTGEDYEGMLVKLYYVKCVTEGGPGFGFDVAGPNPSFVDSMHINNRGGVAYTFDPDSMMVMDVTGILRWDFGQFVISPRSNADFVTHGLNVGVPQTSPSKVAFTLYPNPARTVRMNFALPKAADVELAVYDLSGRHIATVDRGYFAAGAYTREWSGLDAGGKAAGSGVYFVRLRVGTESYNLRAVRLQ